MLSSLFIVVVVVVIVVVVFVYCGVWTTVGRRPPAVAEVRSGGVVRVDVDIDVDGDNDNDNDRLMAWGMW